MSRAALVSLYALLVLIWSSTWVAIKFGLEDSPPLLGAGLRFTLAGAVLLGFAALQRRPLRTDWLLVAVLAAMPFALAYGLVYWGEQYIPSGLAAVLFGVLPLYTGILAGIFLPEEPLRARLVVGVVIAIGGLALSFAESLNLGDEDLALAGAAALALAPLGAAVGNVGQKLRAGTLDAVTLNGWAMLAGGALLVGVSALGEDWGGLRLTPESVGSIVYLAVIGSSVAFVALTVLLRQLTAQAMSFLAMLLPFGALLFGAALYDEALTWRALAGALLVAVGLLIAQSRSAPAAEAPAPRRAAKPTLREAEEALESR